jgi:hypothetical protein
MTKQGKRELLKAIRPRYLKASKAEKSKILNEFVASTRYNRKYAIRSTQELKEQEAGASSDLWT